ncbi:hypothetical protein [Bradyrhizobium sp. HKCCYLS3013]|uniref:hypothetical protein n=1 Tax=Bradyrhizobium sp. HKCCYLS3013 TaxID=3420735 RepID=UPI003EBE2A89
MDYQPAIKGVRPDDLVGYADKLGNFYIGGAGQTPEPRVCFYYRDTNMNSASTQTAPKRPERR